MELIRDGFTIHFDAMGPDSGPLLVLVPGMGEQIGSVEFPDEQCALFTDRGFRVVRIDNRDNGFSRPHASDDDRTTAAINYNLLDMADDVAAVIEAMGVPSAHIVGASLGGFIVRWIAVRHPDRVASLTVVMSGSGADSDDPGPQIASDVPAKIYETMGMRLPRDEAIGRLVDMWRWLWGNSYPFDEQWVRERVTHGYERSYRPEGVGRNLVATIATPSLWKAQTAITCPTLVVHGGEDPCFDLEHGKAIAAEIPNATLWADPKMGHIMHREIWNALADRVERLALTSTT